MKRMSGFLSLLLCLMVCFSFVACGRDDDTERSGRDRDRQREESEDDEEEEDDKDEEEDEVDKPDSGNAVRPDSVDTPATLYDEELVGEIYNAKLVEIYYTIADPESYFENAGEDMYWLADFSYTVSETGWDPDCLVGYVIKDVSGDDIPELLIVSTADQEYYEEGNMVYDIYTIRDGEIFPSVIGWARSRNYDLGDGEFYYRGSSGATESSYGLYHLSDDGTQQIWDEFYFSTYDGIIGDVVYYFNQDGECDPTISEQLDIDGEEFWEYATEIEDHLVRDEEVTPFYRLTTQIGPMGGSAVYFEFADDYSEDVSELEYYETSADPYAVEIVVTPFDDVEDFTYYTVEYGEESGGEASATMLPSMVIGDLSAYEPIVITASFPGDMSSCAVSYVDSSGTERMFSLSVSGMDGSLTMYPIY